jgi:surface antigen
MTRTPSFAARSLYVALCCTVAWCSATLGGLVAAPATAQARSMLAFADTPDVRPPRRAMGLECAPYARSVTGIQLFGKASGWWQEAQGHYARGFAPRVGAVMVFRPHRSMALGHVAAVSGVIDSRTILIDHANWSPINGRRGQVEANVRAVDVSPGNDWSEVKVWYAPSRGLGTTRWPVAGFIYNAAPGNIGGGAAPRASYAPASYAPASYANAVFGEAAYAPTPPARAKSYALRAASAPSAPAQPANGSRPTRVHGLPMAGPGSDPVGDIIAGRSRH